MSAFVCSAKHIAVVAQRVIEKYQSDGTPYTPSDFAEKMARLNVESVDFRYNEKTSEKELKEFVAECRALADDAGVSQEKISDQRLWGAVSCFLYQSCELDECVKSETYKMVKRLEDYLARACKRKHIQSQGWSI